MPELQVFAVEHNCRLFVTGDTKQHHSVQWGDGFRILERSGVTMQAVLTKIHRQGIPELREAIEALSYPLRKSASTLFLKGLVAEISDAALWRPIRILVKNTQIP